MENVPWHSDVKAFSEALAVKSNGEYEVAVSTPILAVSDVKAFSEAMAVKRNGEYEVACEHAHSCCVLLASAEKFKVNGQWYTWIDYIKFHDLVASGKPFNGQDYTAATPSWAIYGAEEGRFDPDQARYRKDRHHNSSRS